MAKRKSARKRYIRGRDTQMREGETTKIGGIGYKGREREVGLAWEEWPQLKLPWSGFTEIVP